MPLPPGAILVPLLLLLLPLAAAAYCGAWVYMGTAPRFGAAPVLKEREQARAAAHEKRATGRGSRCGERARQRLFTAGACGQVTAELERAVRLVQGAEHGEAMPGTLLSSPSPLLSSPNLSSSPLFSSSPLPSPPLPSSPLPLFTAARCDQAHSDFAAHVGSATSLAVYGCGTLTPSRVKAA